MIESDHPLRRWRQENGISQTDLADQINVSSGFISMIETGLKGVSLQTAFDLSKITGISMEEFIREAAE